MRLLDLDPTFIRCRDGSSYEYVAALAEAHGILFESPPPGTGYIAVFFTQPAADGSGAHPEARPLLRWSRAGTGLHDLSVTPSIHVLDVARPDGSTCPGWHGNITNGEVVSA